MLRFALIILLCLSLFSCSSKKPDQRTILCEDEKREATVDYEKGTLRFVNGQLSLRYESELKDLLKQNGIEYQIAGPHGDDTCYGLVMDSLIKEKFGDNFIDKLELVADSLFFERNKNGVFDYSDVDTWPTRENSNDHLGGDFVIDYLNESLTPKASFRFVSNIVGRPHYLIEFTIGNDGRTKNVEIKQRHSTGKFPGTEELIVKEVSKIKDWIPATIRNQPVTARFQMGVAIESTR
jgi:hypothetical protein